MFEKALLRNKERKLLVVHPHATEQIRPLFQENVRSQIKCLDEYFAKDNYDTVNREISEKLLTLPE